MIFKIKDISVFHKGQGRKGLNKGLSFPIKDGWQPYPKPSIKKNIRNRSYLQFYAD